MPQRRCEVCGGAFEAQRSTAKYCGGTCRKRAGRRALAAPTPVTSAEVGIAVETSTLVATVQAELETLGKTGTVEAITAVQLATRMTNPSESGQAVAALTDRLLKVMVLIRSTAVAQEDEVGSARRRREEKRARAAAGQAAR